MPNNCHCAVFLALSEQISKHESFYRICDLKWRKLWSAHGWFDTGVVYRFPANILVSSSTLSSLELAMSIFFDGWGDPQEVPSFGKGVCPYMHACTSSWLIRNSFIWPKSYKEWTHMLLIALLAESNLYRTCLWSALKNLNDINSWSQTREIVSQQATIVADSCCTLWASEGTCSCRNPSVAVIDT